MEKCDDCNHVEMCGWRKELNDQGCEFFGGGAWIPVTERLPEQTMKCLITIRYPDFMGRDTDVVIDVFFKPEWRSLIDAEPKGYFKSHLSGYDEVLAWMPLPEPYGGE